VRLTIHHSLTRSRDVDRGHVDLEVVPGTPLRQIVADFPAPRVWCGSETLDPEHEAGKWPLVAGAILSAQPGRTSIAPGCLHLAAIAGPDSGVIIPVSPMTAIGSASPAAVVRDDTIDAHHVTVWATPEGSLRVKDHGSVNGTGVWSLRGGSLSWRGHRRSTTVRVGDVIAVGRTLLEARLGVTPQQAGPEGRDSPESTKANVSPVATAAGRAREGISAALGHMARWAPPSLGWGGRECTHDATRLRGFPDPTRTEGWSGPVAIGGSHSVDLARAVILARGRRPPLPMPMEEQWLSWLPPALAGDGPIRIGSDSPIRCEDGWTVLTAESDRTTSRVGAITSTGPAVHVKPDTADALARSRAGFLTTRPPLTVRWADAAALEARPAAGNGSLEVVTGVRVEDSAVPWSISLGHGLPHTVVAGAVGSGKTTLLATLTGALAIGMSPEDLTLIILCAGAPGPLEPYMDLPHVKAAAAHVRPRAALRILDSPDSRDGFTVVIADDLDALGPDGRAVTARLEAIASRGGSRHVHVVMATRRPTAVFTPTLRAATATAIALRTDSESDSVEVIGSAAASRLPLDAKGMAIVRTEGRLATVQVALPLADRMPRVRRCGVPLPEVTTLAAAVWGASAARRRGPLAPGGRERPAS
jgi:pSer/pThr/pTyr-binding forkhead associated (FHA) protein